MMSSEKTLLLVFLKIMRVSGWQEQKLKEVKGKLLFT